MADNKPPSTAPASDAPPAGAFAARFPRLSASFQKYSSSRAGRITANAWTRRRPIFIGLAITYGVVNYAVVRREAKIRDTIHPDTWLVLKVHPGSIVDCKSTTNLTALLTSPSAGEDRTTVMELFDVIKALKWASYDKNIRGIFADFSGLHIPSSVSPASLGMAQLEELVEMIHEFKMRKREDYYLDQLKPEEDDLFSIDEGSDTNDESKVSALTADDKLREQLKKAVKELPPPPPSTIAWADSFDSQGSYLLASAFEKVYIQPSGEVPLTGVSMQIPFVKRALDWLGVKVYAEARKEFKSMISTFTQTDGLPPAQLQDEARLLGELSRGLAHCIGVNRFSEMDPDEAADKVTELSKRGPFSAKDALKEGLITDVKYKSEAIKDLGEDPKTKTLASYSRIMTRESERQLNEDTRTDVAVVYLQGTISNAPGDFSASSVIKGLREAGEDENIGAIVLRIDSGGGDVVASDSIWDAVRRVQEDYKKPVVASFGNASASGGYYASAGADVIVACESTITGSIGVASLRPTITKKVFDRVGVSLQTIFTGSKMNSSIHELEPEEKDRHSQHIDETYDTFLEKVCQGRKISRDVIEELAGGRVWTGLAAWVRCHSEKEQVETDSTGSQSSSEGKVVEKELGVSKKESTAPARSMSLTSDWKTTDVTQDQEMSTIRIFASSTSPEKEESAEADPERDETIRKEIIAEFAAEETKERKGRGSGIVALSVVEGQMVDEESRLAAAAHEAAEASHKETAKPATTDDSVSLGPYGRGLIDSIGGIWEAGAIAATLSYNKQVDNLVKGGMTMEQAAYSVRPDAPREKQSDGTVSISTDLRMIKFPKEKTFLERYRELNKHGDRPTLSLLPGFGNIGLQMREFITDIAVQVLVRSWRDPATIQRMMSEVEKERSIRMEHQHHIQMY